MFIALVFLTKLVMWVIYCYLHYLGSINSISDALSHNLCRQNNILQHCLMNSSEGAASRPLNSRAFLWRPQYPPGSNQDYILNQNLREG
uniref:Uncharacterized protein n=1 Tax=Rhizophora mucronata TaxID=61149 RepID=A0A2P2KA93_RHIMU